MVSKVDRLRCDDCGIEIPVWAIVGRLDGTEAMTAEEYLTGCTMQASGFSATSTFGREIAWEMRPWRPPNGVTEK
jgi:hypothetical protein